MFHELLPTLKNIERSLNKLLGYGSFSCLSIFRSPDKEGKEVEGRGLADGVAGTCVCDGREAAFPGPFVLEWRNSGRRGAGLANSGGRKPCRRLSAGAGLIEPLRSIELPGGVEQPVEGEVGFGEIHPPARRRLPEPLAGRGRSRGKVRPTNRRRVND